jgi:hypothetical protein
MMLAVADRGWKRRFDEPIPLPRPENAKVSDVLEHLNET